MSNLTSFCKLGELLPSPSIYTPFNTLINNSILSMMPLKTSHLNARILQTSQDLPFFFNTSKIRCIHHSCSLQVSRCCKSLPTLEPKEWNLGKADRCEARSVPTCSVGSHSEPSCSYYACYSNHGYDIKSTKRFSCARPASKSWHSPWVVRC